MPIGGFSYADDYEQYNPYGGLPPVATMNQIPRSTPSFVDRYFEMMKRTMPNPLLNAGLQVGQSVLGGLAGLFAGDSEEEKLLKDQRKRGNEVYSLLKNRYAQSGNEPEQYLAQFMRATQEQRAREAEGMNARLNLDSGVAQGEMLKNTWNQFLNYSLGAQERSRANKDNLLSLMSQFGR